MAIKVACGSYTGTGSALSITEPTFPPDWILWFDSAGVAHCWTNTMGTSGKPLTGAVALVANTLNAAPSGSGFVVGTATAVNTAAVVYHYVCGTEDGANGATVTYTGSGADDRTIACGFVPDLVLVMAGHGQAPYWRTSDMPPEVATTDLTSQPFNGATVADRIQKEHATDGFVIGTLGSVNTNASTYHALCLKTLAAVFDTFTYNGNGTSQTVGAVGFTPHAALTKRGTASTVAASRGRNHTGLRSLLVDGTGNLDTAITALASGGFSVGSSSSANTNGGDYYAAVWRATDGDGSGPTDPAAGGGGGGRMLLMGVG